MKYLDRLIIALIFLSILGFSYYTSESEENGSPGSTIEPVESIVKKTVPIYSFKSVSDMNASWYGSEFHGRKTANGDYFDKEDFTAAHKYLPFGTVLRLTNKDLNKSVYVKINDRGPFIRNRDLDLSQGAARQLGYDKSGVMKLGVEIVSVTDSIEVMK